MSYPERVQYRERQRLRTADLRDEQEYQLSLAGRHNVGVHRWGIVRGLRTWLDGNIVMVEPGFAVDGYGRTILVRDLVRLQLEAESKCVFLFACQIAEGGCGESLSTHCRDEGRVILSAEDVPLPDIGTNFEVVRAAGLDCDFPPWPVLLGEIEETLSGPKINTSNVRGTRVNVAQIAAASKTSIVKIGKSTLGDQYPFLIITKDKAGALSNRVAVDQENNVQIWGDVIVTESKLAPILLNVANELLRITPKASAGGELRWRSLIQEINARESLVLEFRDLFANKDTLSFALDSDAPTRRSDVKEFNREAKLVEVSFETGLATVRDLPALGIPILLPQPESTGGQNISAKTVDNHDSDFRYLSPTISFESEVKEAESEPCGCRTDDDQRLVYPNGIGFKAGLKPPAIPSRDVYNIKVGEKEKQHEQLRTSVGKFEEGDLNRRFSVGAMQEDNNGDVAFTPWLKVRGNAAVEIPGGQTAQNGQFLMLDVKGALRLPPVKPDPRDPVFTFLLLMAFFRGVLSHGGSPVEIVFTPLPDFFETAQDLTYRITVKNIDFATALKEIEGRDRFVGSSSSINLNLPTADIAPRGSQNYDIKHPPDQFQGLSEVAIEVSILAKIADRKVAGLATSETRPIITSPFVNLSKIPAEVPVGWSTLISIENKADRDLTINGDLIAKGLGQTNQSLTPAVTQLAAGQDTDTTALVFPEDLSGHHTLEVELKYHWPAPTDERTIKTTQDVEVVQMLVAQTIATPVANTAWKFDLKLTNPTENRVTLLGLKVFVTKSGSPTTELDFTLNEPIRKHQSFTQHNIDGIIGLSGTVENIRIEMKFRRKQKTWESVVDNLPDITIP